MRDPAAYQEFLTDFIGRKVRIFGHLAIARAGSVPGLELDAEGRVVRLGGDPFETLQRVLRAFERLSGRASYLTARASLQALGTFERYPGLDFPHLPR